MCSYIKGYYITPWLNEIIANTEMQFCTEEEISKGCKETLHIDRLITVMIDSVRFGYYTI